MSKELSGEEIDELLNAVEDNETQEGDALENEVLSPDEVDNLLSSIDDDSGDESVSEEQSSPEPVIKLYDYIRPEIFTKTNLGDIHGRIQKLAEGAAEKITGISGKKFSFKIESIDLLSLDEMIRSTPVPCNMIKLVYKSGRSLLITVDSVLTGILSNIYLGIPGETTAETKWNSFNAELIRSIAEFLYTNNTNNVPGIISIKDPTSLNPESLLEPVLAVNITSMEGRIDLTLPLTTIIELFPESMKTFTVLDPSRDKWTVQKMDNIPDLWFKRVIKFPVYYATYNNIKATLETGSIGMTPELKGRIQYESN